MEASVPNSADRLFTKAHPLQTKLEYISDEKNYSSFLIDVTKPQEHSSLLRSAYTVQDFCKSLSISESFFWKLVRSGKISTVSFGRRRLVTTEERNRLLREGIR